MAKDLENQMAVDGENDSKDGLFQADDRIYGSTVHPEIIPFSYNARGVMI